MTFSRRLTLKRAMPGGHLATAVLKIKYFRAQGLRSWLASSSNIR